MPKIKVGKTNAKPPNVGGNLKDKITMMRFTILFYLMTVFLILGQSSNGQRPDSLKPEKIDISKMSGTFSEDRFSLILKRNNKFKTIMVAPRPLISKGTWEIHNGTLICYETHRNISTNNEEKKIKGRPIKFMFIIVDGKMYSIVDKKRILFPVKK